MGEEEHGTFDGALYCDALADFPRQRYRHVCRENPTEIRITTMGDVLVDFAIGEREKDGHYEGFVVYGLDFLVAMEKAGYKVVRLSQEDSHATSHAKNEESQAAES